MALTREVSGKSKYDVSMCQVCQGDGIEREDYHFRRLERTCSGCGGRGVILRKDGEMYEEETKTEASDSYERQREIQEFRTEAIRRGIRKLGGDINKMSFQCKKYQKEIGELEKGLSKGTQPKEKALKEQLLTAIRIHVENLTHKIDLKAVRLGEYKAEANGGNPIEEKVGTITEIQ